MWLVLGANGQLGQALLLHLSSIGEPCQGVKRSECDIVERSAVETTLSAKQPSIVINTAAWTAVDDAETHIFEAHQVNEVGPRNLSRVCSDLGIPLVHISTDYVFDGAATSPILEESPTRPLGVYGESKLAGERAIMENMPHNSYIIRTAWLYSEYGKNFAKTMVRRALDRTPSLVVNDQHGQPTHASDLAQHIVEIVRGDSPSGVYHGTCAGEATWYDFASEIYDLVTGDRTLVTAVDTSHYPTRATRPRYSVMSHRKTLEHGIKEMPHWKTSLHSRITDIISAVEKQL